ncbi:MAG: hybrid sensor histidine kinase/response regulator [Desulfurivibrio sp.]|nr:MAG: hybrid sensor histidine kinase/response regulator [Desulfurivibrio sp.]
MAEQVKILCVDDEPNVLRALRRLFIDEDYEIITAASGEEGLAMLEKEYPVQLILSDYRMPAMDGVDFLRRVCEKWPATIRIVLSGYADTATIVAAINEGQIYKFIPKPWDDNELKVTIAKALEVFFLNEQNQRLTRELQQKNDELESINQNLEEIVRERTNDILFQNKVLQFSQNVLHLLPAAVLGIDPDGLIVQSNRMSNQIFAAEAASLTGLQINAALPAEICSFISSIAGRETRSTRMEINSLTYLVNGVAMSDSDSQQGKILFLVPV